MKDLIDIIDNDLEGDLNEINENFFNVKQEIHIRNELVKKYNKKSKPDNWCASEFPRKRKSVDLSILEKGQIINRIEMKYQFPKDIGKRAVNEAIINDIYKPKMGSLCTDFILIIHERSEGIDSYTNGDLQPRYKNLNGDFETFRESLSKLEGKFGRCFKREYIPIKTTKPYESTYHFYVYSFNK